MYSTSSLILLGFKFLMSSLYVFFSRELLLFVFFRVSRLFVLPLYPFLVACNSPPLKFHYSFRTYQLQAY